jgi:hypothetical protein
MAASPNRFPHLDRFLNAYMHQDWRLFGDTLEDVVQSYAIDSSSDDLNRLHSEIIEFLQSEGGNIELDYHRLYPNSVLPSGWDMTANEWLRYVASAAEKVVHS